MSKIRQLAAVLLLVLSLLAQGLAAVAQPCVTMDSPAVVNNAHDMMSHAGDMSSTMEWRDTATMDCCGVLGHCTFGACVLSPPLAMHDFTIAHHASSPAIYYLPYFPPPPIDSLDRPPIFH